MVKLGFSSLQLKVSRYVANKWVISIIHILIIRCGDTFPDLTIYSESCLPILLIFFFIFIIYDLHKYAIMVTYLIIDWYDMSSYKVDC